MSKNKKKVLEKIKPKDYRIYGIFDFETKSLVYVHLNEDQVDLEYELSGYDDSRYDIVEFDVRLI